MENNLGLSFTWRAQRFEFILGNDGGYATQPLPPQSAAASAAQRFFQYRINPATDMNAGLAAS